MTHEHSDGTFVHPQAEMIYNDVEAQIQKIKTQLSKQNPEGKPVHLSTIEQDKNFEKANMTHIRAMAGMFDVIAETNPALAQMWHTVRPNINLDPTPEEQTDIEQQAEQHNFQLFDDINLNN
uniref:Uncharacterized protein n=1 Tax=Brassica campestris TaxID=3711 RepID=M4F351_BRACM